LLSACEPDRLAAGCAALHVDDQAVAEGQDVVALIRKSVVVNPLRLTDDPVVADPNESGLNAERCPRSDLSR